MQQQNNEANRLSILKSIPVFFIITAIFFLPSIINSQVKYTEVNDKLPVRETQYMIRVPENWNGVLLNDLDYYKKADSPRSMQLLNQGYALSGTVRRSDRFKNYDPAHEAHDFVSIFDVFESKFGKPKKIIQLGCSGGGTVTLSMSEKYSDRIDGAIAACAATSPWMANTHLDGLFVLKALLAPDLPIVGLGDLNKEEMDALGSKWEAVVKKAQQTPEGKARIALAITIGQWPAWGSRGKSIPQPDTNNTKELQQSMYESIVRLVPSKKTWGTVMIENAGGGQVRWNTGIDYKDLYSNGNTSYKKAVERLYKEAGIKLNKDLESINRSPRISADKHAVKHWSAPGRTHIGKPKVPLLRIHTIGDGLVYPSMAQGYEELVRKNGYSELFRSAYVNRWGHCSFSSSEWLAAIETMIKRLDTGEWPDTSPEAMNKLAKSLDSNGTALFCDFDGVKKYNRTWEPSVEDYSGKRK